MQGHINSGSGRRGIVSMEVQERIKRAGGVRIQERIPQPGLADLADGQVLPLVPGITETGFPVPSLEIIAEFSHLTAKADVEQLIPVSELFTSGTGIVNAAEPNSGADGDSDSTRVYPSPVRVRYRERTPRILDWHTDAGRA